MVKLIGAFPWLADTTVALEEVGFADEQITRLLAEKRHNQAMGSLEKDSYADDIGHEFLKKSEASDAS